MTSTHLLTGAPLDDQGRLVHDGDAAAQVALATRLLETALAGGGHAAAELALLRVLTTDPTAVLPVLDVLGARLAELSAAPELDVVPVDSLALPGQLVALEGLLSDHTHPSPEGTVMTSTSVPSAATSRPGLREACRAPVHLPGEPGYAEHRIPWNAAVDLRPAAIALPQTVDEVVEVVRAAAGAGLRIAPQSTGHGAGMLAAADLSDAVLVKLGGLTGVTVDPDARTARVVGGTQWQDVVAAAAPHGLTALHGSAADVGVAGYLLGGGLSFYGRRHGVAANAVRAVEVVTPDGSLVRADAHDHADLFWAVRGGGARFGVVVALEIDLLPVPDVYAGMLLWDAARAAEVVPAWLDWAAQAPESATTSLRVMSFPPLPELPPFLSGRRVVVVDGAVLEDDDIAAGVLEPLRELAPELDTFGRIPAAELLGVHMDPPVPTPSVSDHAVLGRLDAEAVTALLDHGPGPGSPLMFVELRQLGGAFGRPAPRGGSLSAVPGDYALMALAVAPTPEAAAAGARAAAAVVEALAPWAAPGRVPTFTENPADPQDVYPADGWERLAAVAAAYDPAGRMVG